MTVIVISHGLSCVHEGIVNQFWFSNRSPFEVIILELGTMEISSGVLLKTVICHFDGFCMCCMFETLIDISYLYEISPV